MSEYENGATVHFTGGLGRDDDDPTVQHVGVVNGPAYFQRGVAFVPLHVTAFNHNLVVASTNIVKVIRFGDGPQG